MRFKGKTFVLCLFRTTIFALFLFDRCSLASPIMVTSTSYFNFYLRQSRKQELCNSEDGFEFSIPKYISEIDFEELNRVIAFKRLIEFENLIASSTDNGKDFLRLIKSEIRYSKRLEQHILKFRAKLYKTNDENTVKKEHIMNLIKWMTSVDNKEETDEVLHIIKLLEQDELHSRFLVKRSAQNTNLKENRILSEEENVLAITNMSHNYTNNLTYGVKKMSIITQSALSPEATYLLVLLILGLIAYGLFVFIKKRKKNTQQQSTGEKTKFIPRLKISVDAEFGDSKNDLKFIDGRRTVTSNKNNPSGLKMFTVTNKQGEDASLADNHQSTFINENIFTNLDSPRSDNDNSIRETPKNLGFNIEFSTIEQKPKRKSIKQHE